MNKLYISNERLSASVSFQTPWFYKVLLLNI